MIYEVATKRMVCGCFTNLSTAQSKALELSRKYPPKFYIWKGGKTFGKVVSCWKQNKIVRSGNDDSRSFSFYQGR